MNRYAVALLYHRKSCGQYSQTTAESLIVKIVSAASEAEAHRAALAKADCPTDWLLYTSAVTPIPDAVLAEASEVWA